MKIIDFDDLFHKHLAGWMRERAASGVSPEQMEEQVGAEYVRFINLPTPALDGATPAAYFAAMTDMDQLVKGMRAYQDAGIEPPELLTDRIGEFGAQAVDPLLRLATDSACAGDLRATALNLMIGLGDARPIQLCFQLIDARAANDDLADIAAELLQSLGEKPVPLMLDKLKDAHPESLKTYLDLLCNFPGDERIYTYVLHEFHVRVSERALFASLLGKLGDPRAIAPLTVALSMADLNYLDYLEIANAIDMLGGDAGERTRDFSGDPDYEALKGFRP
ncbi:MAG: hypothetical protein RSA12_10435 [Clostridia bacterium]